MIAIELGKFASGLSYDALPQSVSEAVKLRTLDVLASGLAGFQLGAHTQLRSVMRPQEGATVWGEGTQLALRDAVLVNSFLAHCTYMDDGDRYSGAHPAAVVVPSALALAESEHLDGARLVAAIAAGYEVMLRIGQCIYPSAVTRGFQSTAILGAIGSAAACANLLGLSTQATKNAIAISCNLGVGLKEALKTSSSQPLQVARSCEGGLLAALYAQQGAEGPDAIVENGFVKAFADSADVSGALTGLGSRYRIFDTYIKIHGGCRGNHASIDVVQDLVKANDIKPGEIDTIAVSVDSVTMAGEIHDPVNGNQAQFSVPFAVAVSLLEGNSSIFQFTDAKIADPRIRAMMRKIHVRLDKSLDVSYPDKRGAIAEIALADGRRLSMAIDNAKGEPEYPLSTADGELKFVHLAHAVLGDNTDRIRDLVMNLQDLADVGQLAAATRYRLPVQRVAPDAL